MRLPCRNFGFRYHRAYLLILLSGIKQSFQEECL